MTVRPEPAWLERADGPYLVDHDLADGGLLTIAHLVDIVRGRSKDDVPCGGAAGGDACDPSAIIAAIGAVPGWAVLRDRCWSSPQSDALQESLGSIADWLSEHEPGMHEPDRSAIVTSTGAVTHLHLDADESYLLQVSGRKAIGFLPPDVVDAHALESVIHGDEIRLSVPRERVIGRLRKFVIGPGQGVHIPFGWPHFTRVEDEASISVSLAFQTDRTRAIRSAVLAV